MSAKKNDAEYLVEKVNGERFYQGQRLAPSKMLWKCSTEGCTTPPKPQRRGQYENKLICNTCANRVKSKDKVVLEKRGRAISKAIADAGDKWSEVAKKNMSNPGAKERHSEAMKRALSGNEKFKQAARKTAIKNNKETGFGTAQFSKKIWENMDSDKRQSRIEKAVKNSVATDRETHIRLVEERYPGFKVIEFCFPDNIYACPIGHSFPMRGGNFLKRGSCPECSPKSSLEMDLLLWVRQFLPETRQNKRVLYLDETQNGNRALEIDIFDEKTKFGIEVHGLFFHQEKSENSEYGVEKDFHKKKADLAKAQGITLLQFFEDELVYKEEIVKSMILTKIGIGQAKVFARKCELFEVDSKQAEEFLEDNHLQGGCRSFMRLGLRQGDELISLLTFRKSGDSAEIARFCTKTGVQVVGGFSKLLSFAEGLLKKEGFKDLITYADRRYSQGAVYQNSGFDFIHVTDPDFFWTKANQRYARQISWGKSTREMYELGYRKIYGAGHSLWKKKL